MKEKSEIYKRHLGTNKKEEDKKVNKIKFTKNSALKG
jgi:hypothetical protein